MLKIFLLLVVEIGLLCFADVIQYEISDDLGLGRKFDGIGGISGGGVTFEIVSDTTLKKHYFLQFIEKSATLKSGLYINFHD